ncbi:DUF1120 domain-containing protein [Enterobacter wuhouensis]|uniref:DUF1120 domain-containing protein n=1 Tax=Enterobacter wuhouensis TaxID=2529381 RepID=UPI002FD29D75
MKKLLIATTMAMALSVSAHAADSTAQLKVQGVLTNDACTPTMSGGGTVDFGTHYVDTLSSTAFNQLGSKDFTLSIHCPTATAVSWGIEDNVGQPAAVDVENTGFISGNLPIYADQDGRFGVGKTAGGVPIGAYVVAVNKTGVSADGVVTGEVHYRVPGNSTWMSFSSRIDNVTSTSPLTEYALLDSEAKAPIAFIDGVFPMRVTLAVDKTSTLAITDDTPIAGQATITLSYL